MAKQLLLSVLVDTLGPYVEGLSIENLKLGVWSGKIELFNLQLKPDVLNNLNLPVTIVHGSLKSLKLKIPWTSLESKPVRVSIDGLYLLATPLDVENLSPEEIIKKSLLDKKSKLKMAEEAVLAAGVEADVGENSAEKASYIQQLTAKIVDNLEVTLTNVHIRYEDAFTMPTVVAAGITLDRITLSTTDASWKEMFVSRVEKDKTISPTIHKLGRMENLAIYWNTRSARLDQLSSDAIEKEMQALIYRTTPVYADSSDVFAIPEKLEKEKSSMSMTKFFSSPVRKSVKMPGGALVPGASTALTPTDTSSQPIETSASTQLMYLLPPPNKLEVRIIHTDNAQSANVPKIDLAVEITGLRVDFDKLQYQQLLSTIRMFAELEKQKLISLHRPRQRPTVQPKLWWKYAYQLVVGKPATTTTKLEVTMLCLKYRRRYIKLVKSARYRIKNNTPVPKPSSAEYLTLRDEEAMIATIEELLPLQTLIVFRQLAAAEICREEKLQEKPKTASSYFSSFFGSKAITTPSSTSKVVSTPSAGGKTPKAAMPNPFALTSEEEDDDILFEQIQSKLAVKSSTTATETLLRMNMVGGLAVTLTSDGYPICRLELAMTSALELNNKAFQLSVSLYDFFVEDLCTSRAVLPYIIVSQSQAMAALENASRTRTVEASTALAQRVPQCTVVFSSSETESSLSIKAAPVEVIWNEICFEKILAMFLSSSEDASLVLSNPALVARMSQFAADAAIPPLQNMNISIEIDAPKFIIPEDSESLNGGCMILDMGILHMQGLIAPTGAMNIQIGLTSINVGMPEITTDRYKLVASAASGNGPNRLYLVNPFNISLSIQNEIVDEADMTIALLVSDVIAQLDTQKITRILRVVNIITRTINASMETESSVSSLDNHSNIRSPLLEESELIMDNAGVMAPRVSPPEQKRLPTDCLLIVTLTSPLLSAELAVSDCHAVVLSVTSLLTRVVQRPHDMSLDFKLKSLSLDDSLRSENQKSIIGTKISASKSTSSADLRPHLCSITLRTAFDKLSPFYVAYKVATDIEVQFSRMNLSVDELAILRLCPLVQRLAKGLEEINTEAEQYKSARLLVGQAAAHRKALQLQASSRRAMRLKRASGSETIATPESIKGQKPTLHRSPALVIPAKKPVVSANIPTGLRINCELASVSLMLMRTPEALTSLSVLEKVIDLNLAYSAEISGLWANITILDSTGTDVKLRLQSFSVTDRRPTSTKYVYKKLLCRSTFASEYSSSSIANPGDMQKTGGDDAHDDDTGSSEFGALASIGSGQTQIKKSLYSRELLNGDQTDSATQFDSCILEVDYKEQQKGHSSVDIRLTEVTSFLTLDSIIDLSDVGMKNVDAVLKLVDAFSIIAGNNSTVQDLQLEMSSIADALTSQNSPVSPSQALQLNSGAERVSGSTLGSVPGSSFSPSRQSASSVSVNVSVINPRLLILENAAIANGRAIVFRSEIFVSYSTETGDATLADVQERLNLSLQGAEVFILTEGVTKGAPQQVVEPTSIGVMFNRRMEGPILLYCKAALNAQDIIARLSLNDIQLANKMLKKAKAKQAKLAAANASVTPVNSTDVGHHSGNKRAKVGAKESGGTAMTHNISMFEVNVEMGNINFLAINDANDLYQPVLRFAVDNFCMDARGAPKGGELSGDGALVFSIDYFNNSISIWEPVIERCRPCWTVQYSFLGGLSVELIHDRTFQINVSGSMTKQVSLLLGLLNKIGEDEDTHTNNQHAVVFYNHLGVPVEISDNATSEPLLVLFDATPLPLVAKESSRPNNRSCTASYNNIPVSFNLRVLGDMEHERKPILGLPLNIHRPLPHYLRPELGSGGQGGISPIRTGPAATTDMSSTEPIVEEVYENQRYVPFQAKWKPTAGGLLGDPCQYSDAQGVGNRDPRTIQLPGDRWEWVQSEWVIDKHAIIGKEIDADGWEYATNFGAFTASKQRRTQQPFDMVRRRKLVRTRMLKTTPKDQSSRALVMFWEVDIDHSGFRHIHLRSAMELTNLLPCSMLVMLYGFQGGRPDQATPFICEHEDAIVLDPVLEGQKVSVPLVYSHASFMKFKLLVERDIGVEWSIPFDCRIMTGGRGKSGYSELLKEIECISESQEMPGSTYFQGVFRFSDKALSVVFSPYAVIHNHLPCDVLFRCMAASKTSNEFGVVHPGHKQKLTYFDGKSALKLALQVGSYMWSSQSVIPVNSKLTQTVDILSPSESTGGMSVTVSSDRTKQNGWHMLEIHVYVTYMLVDRSQLSVSVRTKRGLPAPVNAASKSSIANSDGSVDGIVNASKTVERRSYGMAAVNDVKGSWIEGGNNVVLFQADDNYVSFGINKGTSWSETFSLVSIGGSRVQFEIVDNETKMAYQLAYSLTTLPGSYQATQVVTVMPCYTIVNTLGESIRIRQADDSDVELMNQLTIQSMQSCPWHRASRSAGTSIQIATDLSGWSVGAIDVNEIGSYVLVLPLSPDETFANSKELFVIHVDVKFSDPDDFSHVSVVIWRAAKDKNGFFNTASICIQNDTDLPLTLLQDSVDFKIAGLNPKLFEICVLPGENLPFGWVDPSAGTKVRAVIDTSLVESIGQQVVMDLAKVGYECNLEMTHYSVELDSVQLIVKAGAGGRILHVIRRSIWEYEEKHRQIHPTQEFPEKDNIFLKLSFHSMALSLIAERPVRRELFNVFVDNIDVQWSMMASISTVKTNDEEASSASLNATTHSSSSIEADTESSGNGIHGHSSRSLRGFTTSIALYIMDVQVDNYSETAIYPVLLNSYNSPERKEAAKKKSLEQASLRWGMRRGRKFNSESEATEDPLNFITIGAVTFVPQGSLTATYKYIAVRILEIKLAVDTSTLQLYFLDLHNDLIGESVDQALARANPGKWIQKFNSRTIIPQDRFELVNISRAQKAALVKRMYIEQLVLHPIKIRMSYQHTNFPRDSSEDVFSTPQYRWLKIIQGIAAVDDFQMKLKSFIVSDALESSSTIVDRVARIYVLDLKKQIVEIATLFVGSLRAIGKPVGLYRNIGAGVKDLFYEPYQGMMYSPESFVLGVTRGTGSLFKNISTGVISSTAAIVETATKGVSKGANFLSGDAEFTRQREEKRRQQSINSGGLLAGVKAGGESVFSGIKSGVTGLVTKPFEEGRKTGVTGFAKGLGLGAIGVIVKPVMGVTDGMAMVAHGISNQISDIPSVDRIRPQRALHHSTIDASDLVLVPLDLLEAKIQAYVVKMVLKDGKKDSFFGSVILTEANPPDGAKGAIPGQVIFLTDKLVCNAQYDHNFNVSGLEWKMIYGDISHCVLQLETLTVDFIIYKSSSGGGSGGGVLNPTSKLLSAMGSSTISVACSDQDSAIALYTLLYRMADKMGSPSNMLSVDIVVANAKANWAQGEPAAPSTPQRSGSISGGSATPGHEFSSTELDGYVFGSVNILKYGSISCSESEVLARCETRLAQQPTKSIDGGDGTIDGAAFNRDLDQKVWRLIYEWGVIHPFLQSSRCLAALIINRSEHPVQVLRTEQIEGRNIRIIGGSVDVGGYDAESRTIFPGGGCAVIFAYAYRPTILDPGHAKVRVFTSAFSGLLSSRKTGTACSAVGGYDVRFLEKSSTDWWSKYVILIT